MRAATQVSGKSLPGIRTPVNVAPAETPVAVSRKRSAEKPVVEKAPAPVVIEDASSDIPEEMTAEQAMQAIGGDASTAEIATAVGMEVTEEVSKTIDLIENSKAMIAAEEASNDEPTPAPAPAAPVKPLFAPATPAADAAAPAKKVPSIFNFANQAG